jgi:hypothetical protein
MSVLTQENFAIKGRVPPSCDRCHGRLVVDTSVLDDARRQGMTLSSVLLRCDQGHTVRVEMVRPRVVYRFTCGWCEDIVIDLSRKGHPLRNHPACVRKLYNDPRKRKSHQLVEVRC